MQLNHTIIYCSDRTRSSRFLTDILGRQAPDHYGPFAVVVLDNDVSLDFLEGDGAIAEQHLAFLISDSEFDEVFGRIKARHLDFWADPGRTKAGVINHNDGGRGVYFSDPDGHLLEVLTVPYGGA
jgi:catechol 2,3-dioxygenase-like lactoylglutathione lyase family enzyme